MRREIERAGRKHKDIDATQGVLLARTHKLAFYFAFLISEGVRDRMSDRANKIARISPSS